MKPLIKDFKLFAKDHKVSNSAFDYYFNPNIIEERKLNVATMDVFSRLLMDRIVFLGCEIDNDVANVIQAQLLYLQSLDKKEDISLYINSPGGVVSAGLGIFDTMYLIKPKVNTICTGLAASMAATLLCSGKDRSILPHAKVMIHQPSTATGYLKCSDFLVEANEIEKTRKELNKILSLNTKQPLEVIERDCMQDKWFNAQEAKDYGLVDKIL